LSWTSALNPATASTIYTHFVGHVIIGRAAAAGGAIIAGAAGSVIIAGAAEGVIITGAAGSVIIAGAAESVIIAGAAGSVIIAGAALLLRHYCLLFLIELRELVLNLFKIIILRIILFIYLV